MKKKYALLVLISLFNTTLIVAQSSKITGNLEYVKVINILNESIDTLLEVGSMGDTWDVGSSGAAGYSIPIHIPPGTEGVQPNIAIQYNSQGGNGILGHGWGISGITSSIRRVSKTTYHDGTVSAFEKNDKDALMLDGKRLKCVTLNHFQNNARYKTESEDFSNITLKRSSDIKFVVQTKDGWTLNYEDLFRPGSSIHDSYIWRITKATDPYGNYIEYVYEKDNSSSQVFLAEIKYTGNDNFSITPYNKIQFYYKRKANNYDKKLHYLKGKDISENLMLDSIAVIAEDIFVHGYKLEYSFNQHAHLTKVTQWAGDKSRKNPVVIVWDNDPSVFSKSQINLSLTVPSATTRYYSLDYNGDGRSDIIRLINNGTSITSHLYKNIDGKNYSSVVGIGLDKIFDKDTYINYVHVADINNDGMDDLVIMKKYRNDKGTEQLGILKHDVYISTGAGFVKAEFNSINDTWIDVRVAKIDSMLIIRNGNFLGEGENEVLICHLQNRLRMWRLLGIDESTNPPKMYVKYKDTIKEQVSRFLDIVDYDADGRPELLLTNYENPTSEYKYKIARINRYLYTDSLYLSIVNEGILPIKPKEYDHRVIGDFNGDGLTDVFLYDLKGSPKNALILGTGAGFTKVNTGITTDISDIAYYVADMDGDGLSDIIRYRRENGVYKIIVTPGSSNFYRNYDYSSFNKTYNNFPNLACFGDFNGDGKTDILHVAEFYGHTLSLYKNFNQNLVYSIKNSMGVQTRFYYTPLSAAGNGYVRGTDAVYPVMNYSSPLYVVKSVKSSNGIGGYFETTYKYQNARMHLHGKGFLGFEKMTKKNVDLGIDTVCTFGYNSKFYFQYPTKEEIKKGGDFISVKKYDYLTTELTNDRYYTYLKNSVNEDYLLEVTQTSEFVRDNVGNLRIATTQYWSGVNPRRLECTDVRKTTYGNFIDKDNYYVPLSDTLIFQKGYTETRKIQSFEYYTERNNFKLFRPWKVHKHKNDANAATTTVYKYAYDKGMEVQCTTQATNNDELYSYVITKYDKNNRWGVSVNTNGEKHRYQYEPRFGIIAQDTSDGGEITRYMHDYWGRKLRTEYADGTQVNETYWWVTNIPRATSYTLSQPSGESFTYTFYDQLGREVKTYRRTNHDINQYTCRTYNSAGQVITDTLFFSELYLPGRVDWIDYTYDAYGRKKSEIRRNLYIEEPLSNIGYGYLNDYSTGMSKVYISDYLTGIVTVNEYNPRGNLTYKTENGNKISYDYYLDGMLRKVSSLGSDNYYEYDVAGNRTLASESNTGSKSYVYNALGQLKSETDARGTVTSYDYDSTGRTLHKIINVGSYKDTTYYQYETSGYAKGKLNTLRSSATKYQIAYGYDYKGRMTSKSVIVDGEIYRTHYEYYANGKLKSTSYPSSSAKRFEIGYQYFNERYGSGDQKCGLQMIFKKSDSTIYWQATVGNSWGVSSRFYYGNKMWTESAYNWKRQLTGIVSGIRRTLDPWEVPPIEVGPIVPIKPPISLYGIIYTPEKRSATIKAQHEVSWTDIRWKWDPAIQQWGYEYNNAGLMVKRTDVKTNQSETFTYDDFLRLKNVSYKKGNTTQKETNFTYNKNGNMDLKSDVGELKYLNPKKHLLTNLDPVDNSLFIGTENCSTEYTPFHKIKKITEGQYSLTFSYGPDEERIKTVLKKGTETILTKYFIGDNFEIEIYHKENNRKRELSYIYTDFCVIINVRDSRYTNDSMFYVFTDHLGSFDKITNQNGAVVETQSFDVWGNRRNADNWTQYKSREAANLFDRGFTGHEHLNKFNIINMNGRLYDPVIARFFSFDPLAEKYPNISPYAYGAYNPLRYTDPTGMEMWTPEIGVNGHIYLRAEEGDTGESLANYFGGRESALNYVTENALNASSFNSGELIPMKANAFTDLTHDAFRNPAAYSPDGFSGNPYDDNRLNCHTVALGLSNNINVIGYKQMSTDLRDKIINYAYQEVTPEQAVFGKTLVTFGYAHTAVYFGQDKDGNVYVFDVMSTGDQPSISKIKNRVFPLNGTNPYGPVRSINNNDVKQQNNLNIIIDRFGRSGNGGEGYYNPKK